MGCANPKPNPRNLALTLFIPSDDYFVFMLESVWNQLEDEQKTFDEFLDSLETLFVLKPLTHIFESFVRSGW